MTSARFLVAMLILVGATLAACSGNFGSGTTPPNGLLPSGNLAGIVPTPTPTPNSASNIVTIGSNATFQPLPSAAGYSGAIAFAIPSPKPSGFSDIAVGATLSLYAPSDTPDLNLLTKGKKGVKRERRARALAFVTLVATHDITLDAYPKIAIDVPRDIVTVYRENEFGLALYNAGNKDTTFRLAVAELDLASAPPTASPNPSAPPPPTNIPVSAFSALPSASPSASPQAGPPNGPPGSRPSGGPPGTTPSPSVSPTLPPQRITFTGTAQPLKLVANRPVVFALYAFPLVTPSPSPSPSGAAHKSTTLKTGASPSAEASPEASASAGAAATGSPAAAASGVTAAPSPAATKT